MKSRILPRNYHNWLADFKLAPDGMVKIITTDRRVFTVRVRKAGSSYFFHDGWFNMIQSLLLPNKSLLLFQYECLLSFLLIYFYQDLALAQNDFLYCQTSQLSEHKDHLFFFIIIKLKNIIPTNHVAITAYPNRTWLVFMEKHGQNLYMTTGWNQIKEDMKIQDGHYIIFDMISESKFDMMVFRGTEDLVRIPEGRIARVKVEVKEEVNE
ncbi:putative transcription factor B3-Domain family [Helianthus anomalus]